MNENSPINGGRLAIQHQFNPDPLRKQTFHVAVAMDDGSLQIISTKPVEEPIEMLRLDVSKNQVVGFKDRDTVILDAVTGVVVEKFDSYKPEPQSPDEPITPHNAEIRDRWIGRMFQWLLPPELLEADDTPENQAKIKAHLDSLHVEMAISPGGTQVVFFRGGASLAEWCAFL
jgi:hypothetical protein